MARVSGPGTTTVGIGVPVGGPGELLLDIAPQHPSAHGALRLALTLDGDRIATAEPIVGYMHRGAEKLFEVRDYRQILVLTNRHDWLSAFSNELGLVLALEKMLGIEVPVRAVWLRTLLAELNRVLSHLAFLGALPGDGAPVTAPARESLQAVMEELAGGRMHFMFNRIGGLKDDTPAGWSARCRAAVAAVRPHLPAVASYLAGSAFVERTRGVGILDPFLVGQYGLSGPVARASGVALDLRTTEPYLAYDELPAGVLRVVTRDAGDCLARFEVLLDQVTVSLDIADACLDALAPLAGPVNVRLPKVVRAPEGETYCWTENPLGINGYWLVSRGDKTPYRLKLRTASFNNVQALRDIVPGARVVDLVPILTSMFFVIGDIDK
ncbi:MAG: NADH-quinone oxidoreductase subunit [Frankiaceae bacterium]|nr:NADH-quinone oxidoreductase subunit [Frankiaceae bacterium]